MTNGGLLMKKSFNSKIEVRIVSDTWSGLVNLSGQFGYKNVSSFLRAVIDTLIYGATTESQQQIDAALLPFVKQSFVPSIKIKNDFFEFISQDEEYLGLIIRLESADDFYHEVIDYNKHPESSLFVEKFLTRYKYAPLPRDMKYLLTLFYNDPVEKAKTMEKYAALVRYRIRENQEAAADAR